MRGGSGRLRTACTSWTSSRGRHILATWRNEKSATNCGGRLTIGSGIRTIPQRRSTAYGSRPPCAERYRHYRRSHFSEAVAQAPSTACCFSCERSIIDAVSNREACQGGLNVSRRSVAALSRRKCLSASRTGKVFRWQIPTGQMLAELQRPSRFACLPVQARRSHIEKTVMLQIASCFDLSPYERAR